MSTKKNSASQAKPNSRQKSTGWFSGGVGTAISCAVLAGVFVACTYAAWKKIGAGVLSSPDYFVGPGQIEITPAPRWITRSNLPAEVYRDLSRQGPLRIMDDNLVERVALGFSAHPWVAKVEHVQKYFPARVKVDLLYRKPVCMVEISGGLMPVDAQATVLPRDDFSPVEAAKYPRLAGVDRGPAGPVGSRWGDVRVAGGAEIAGHLLPLWEKLDLQYIVPAADGQAGGGDTAQAGQVSRSGQYSYVIFTRQKSHTGGVRILWGRAPVTNQSGELTAAQKIKKLEQFFAEHGAIDYPQGPAELDLRH
jgi:hypothetical protein